MTIRASPSGIVGIHEITDEGALTTAPVIVPRWEWRAFGLDREVAEAAFAGLQPERVEESDETYVLSRVADTSVKVRGGRLDVKVLEAVRGDGLEQWRPVMKATFPVSAVEAGAVVAALEGAGPPARRADSPDELVAQSPNLRALAVHKHREHYNVDGCLAELTSLRTANGTSARSPSSPRSPRA